MKQLLFLFILSNATACHAQIWAIDSEYSHTAIFNPEYAHIISNNTGGYTYLGSYYSSQIPGQSPVITRVNEQGDVIGSNWYLSAHNSWFYEMERGRYGDAFIAGHAYRNDLQKAVIAIAKLTATDSVEWVIHIDATAYSTARASAIAIDELGNVFVTGILQQGVSIYDSFLIKVDKDSNVLWGKSYPSGWSFSLEYESGKLYRVHNDGPSYDAKVSGFDTSGTSLWVKAYDLKDVDRVTELTASSQGLVIYVNPYDSVNFVPFQNTIIRTDLDGNLVDATEFGLECRSAVYFDDGSFAFVTSVADSAILVKCDANFNVEWTTQLKNGNILGKIRTYGEEGAFVWHSRELINLPTVSIETISANGEVCDSIGSPQITLTPVSCTELTLNPLVGTTLNMNVYNDIFGVLADTVTQSDNCSLLIPIGIAEPESKIELICSLSDGLLRAHTANGDIQSDALVVDISGKVQDLGIVHEHSATSEWQFETAKPGIYIAQFRVNNTLRYCKFVVN